MDVRESRARVDFVQILDALVHVVLDGREGGHYCGGPEAVGDHGEVGEGSLDAWVQDRLGAGVAQGRPVLVQQVHQLLADKPTKEKVRKLDLTDGKILGQWNGHWSMVLERHPFDMMKWQRFSMVANLG